MEDYEPFGEEWEKEMKKLPKKMLIGMLKEKMQNELNVMNGLEEIRKRSEE